MTPSPADDIEVTRASLQAAMPPAQMRREHTLAAIFLAAFGLIGIVAGGGFALMDWQWRRGALRADADVTALEGSGTVVAEVRYTDQDGTPRTARASAPFGSIDALVGQRIPILYSPGQADWVTHDDPPWHWVGPALFTLFGLAPMLFIPFMFRQLRRQEARYARLERHGARTPVERASTRAVPWGKFTRHAVIATWRDRQGRLRHTLAGPYTYDPAPLLDVRGLVVLEDRDDPAGSVIATSTLPPEHPRPPSGS